MEGTITDPPVLVGDMMIAYGGNLRRKNASFIVQMVQNGKHQSKTFNSNLVPDALATAIKWKHDQSDAMNQTRRWSASYIDQGLMISDEVHQYIAGFFDGDGSISCTSETLQIKFHQSQNDGVPPVLVFIQKHYGGMLQARVRKYRLQSRVEHTLLIRASNNYAVAGFLVKFASLKYLHAQMALEWNGAAGNVVSKKQISERLKIAHTQDKYHLVEIDQARLTDSYLAGLFDADGSIGAYTHDLSVTFAQKSSTLLLECIQNVFQVVSCIDDYRLTFSSRSSIVAVLTRMLPHLVMKKRQGELMLQLVRHTLVHRKRKLENTETLGLIQEIKRLKRL